MNSYSFGWQLLYKTIEQSLKKDADVLVALAHWQLLKSGNLLCLGNGDDKTFDDTEKGTELLPDEWNFDEKTYALRYRSTDKLYILLGAITENVLIMNLMDVKSLDVTNVVFDIKETVKSINGSLETIVPNHTVVVERMRKELFKQEIGKIISTEAQTIEIKETPKNPINILPCPERPNRISGQPNNLFNDLYNVGRSDLDPFGRGGGSGGGMLFQPPRFDNNYVPNLGRPPGARFDPFGPPDADPLRAGRRPNSNDHFRPPDYYDDMFM